MPYIYSEAMEAIKHGWPVSVRAMGFEFPEDRTAWSCDQQFMLGSRILVAPVFNEEGDVEFYLPEGRWTSFWDAGMYNYCTVVVRGSRNANEVIERVLQGPKWFKEKHDFTTLPLFVRQGTILVLGNEGEKRTVYDWVKPENHEVNLFEPNAESTFQVYDSNGVVAADLTTVEEHGTWKIKGMDARVRRMSRAQNY